MSARAGRMLALLTLATTLCGCAAHGSRVAVAAPPRARVAARHDDTPRRGKIAAPAVVPAGASDAIAEALAKAAQEPSEPWWPYHAAELQEAVGRSAAAESSLRLVLARDPAYAPALTRLSRLLDLQGRHEEAIRLLAPVRDPNVSFRSDERAAILAGLALHEAALGRDADARATLAAVGRGGKEDVAGVTAYLAVRAGSADSALALTAVALRANPASAANHDNRGIALLRASDPDGAAREFERAIELDPTLPGPYYNLAILERWYRLDREAAAKRFAQYAKLSHADPDSLFAELGKGLPPAPVAGQENDR